MTLSKSFHILAWLRATAISVAVAAGCLAAQGKADNKEDASPLDLTIEENIATPPVPNKASAAVSRHMERIASVFEKHSLEVKRMRKGEVISIVVPAHLMFQPNDTVLASRAGRILAAFKKILELPQLYKVLVVVHTDDTGSDAYANRITMARADAIDMFLEGLCGQDINLVPYGVGRDEPLAPDNHSIANRMRNRRIDFIIIPEKTLIEQARSGKL